jgi:hypothetical protein
MTTSWTSGGARRIVINFNDTYNSCAAQVLVAKEVGASLIRSGHELEIQSAVIGGTSCSVRRGNVFGQ